MQRWILVALATLGLSLGCIRPAFAYNPRVTLRVSEATGLQILEKLGEAVKLNFSLPDPRFPQLEQVRRSLSVQQSFQWDGVRLHRVLSDLAERYGIRFATRPSGHYTVYLNDRAEPPIGRPGADGLVAKATRLQVRTETSIALDAAGRKEGSGSLQVYVSVDPSRTDIGALSRLENVIARDDLGNILPGDASGTSFVRGRTQSGPATFPVSFHEPDLRAGKLVWLQADVYASTEVNRHELEIPLPIPMEGITRTFQGVELRVHSVREIRAAGDEFGPFSEVEVKLEGSLPAGESLWSPNIHPPMYLRSRTGKIFDYSSGNASGNGVSFRGEKLFSQVREPVSSLVFVFTTPTEPTRVQTIRLLDLPIPHYAPTAAGPARRPVAPFRGGSQLEPEERGSAVLVNRVTLGTTPASSGPLQVGLAVEEKDGWGPTRWRQLEVDSRGEARLKDLKPGRYRLLRRFWPRADTPASIWTWQGEEVIVELTDGKETQAPPLSGSVTPVARPTVPAKPVAVPGKLATGAPRAPAKGGK